MKIIAKLGECAIQLEEDRLTTSGLEYWKDNEIITKKLMDKAVNLVLKMEKQRALHHNESTL